MFLSMILFDLQCVTGINPIAMAGFHSEPIFFYNLDRRWASVDLVELLGSFYSRGVFKFLEFPEPNQRLVDPILALIQCVKS
jgi:hypothetical protein